MYALFFSTESAKLLISHDLLAWGMAGRPQNIGNKDVTRKIFRNKDLGVRSGR
jgi:hypothetical protein